MQATDSVSGLILALILTGCGEKPSTLVEVNSREITLPSGAKIFAEPVQQKTDMIRGMMFRDSLGADQGMLFIYAKEDRIPYWTFQVRMPLDIIWIDRQHRVVDLALNAPPCRSQQSDACPAYGGHEPAQFVLEVNGGVAAKNQVKIGDVLEF